MREVIVRWYLAVGPHSDAVARASALTSYIVYACGEARAQVPYTLERVRRRYIVDDGIVVCLYWAIWN